MDVGQEQEAERGGEIFTISFLILIGDVRSLANKMGKNGMLTKTEQGYWECCIYYVCH